MLRKKLRRFMAALLCGTLVCGSAGMEQTVYAAPSDAEEIVGEAGTEESGNSDNQEDAEMTVDDATQPGQEEADLQEETDIPSAGSEEEPAVDELENEPVAADLENDPADETWETSGSCGVNAMYEMNLETGVIRIYRREDAADEGDESDEWDTAGKWAMADYTDSDGSLAGSTEISLPPWYEFRDRI